MGVHALLRKSLMNSLHTQKDSTVQKEPLMTSKLHTSPVQASVETASTGMRMTAITKIGSIVCDVMVAMLTCS